MTPHLGANGIRYNMLGCQKQQFQLPDGTRYLNCAYMSPLSTRVVEAGRSGLVRKCAPMTIQPSDFFRGPDRVRELFARLVHAPDAGGIAVIPSVSYGFAIVARNTTVRPGQNVVVLEHQFPSNVYAWRRLCTASEARLRVIDVPPDETERGAALNEALLRAIDGDTALVAVPSVHWTDGTRLELESVGERARAVGAAFVIDGTQSVGAAPLHVPAVKPDALICAAYKWLLGPYSIGVAYFGPRYLDGFPLEETWMGRAGSEDFAGLVEYTDEYRAGAARFDVGEASNFVLTPMLEAALEQLLEWGVPNIQEYCDSLTAGPVERLAEAGFGAEAPPFRSSHLFGLRLPAGADPRRVQRMLASRHIFVSVRGSVVRVSPHVYNEASDLEALEEALCDAFR